MKHPDPTDYLAKAKRHLREIDKKGERTVTSKYLAWAVGYITHLEKRKTRDRQ